MTGVFAPHTGDGPWADAAATASPENPFLTQAYADARSRQGEQPWWIDTGDPTAATTLCLIRAGRISRTAQLPSTPALPGDHSFWHDLVTWARGRGVTELVLDSFSAAEGAIPVLGTEQRHRRSEFHFDLTVDDPFAALSSSHKRQLKRAEKAGLSLRTTSGLEDVTTHLQLMMAARERRGGADTERPVLEQSFRVLIETGAGLLAQVVRGADSAVVASALILRSARGGYHHSSGSGPDGNDCGATHFLFVEIGRWLKAEGATRFNLGGVREPETGLRTFKERFGAREVVLDRVAVDLTRPWHRLLRKVAALARR